MRSPKFTAPNLSGLNAPVAVALLATLVLVLPIHQQIAQAQGDSESALPQTARSEETLRKEEFREILDSSAFYFELPAFGKERAVSFTELLLERNAIFYFFSSSSSICWLQERFVQELFKWTRDNPTAKVVLVGINIDPHGERVLSERFTARVLNEGMRTERKEGRGEPPSKSEAEGEGDTYLILLDPGARETGSTYEVREKGVPMFFFFTRGGFPIKTVEGFTRDLVSIAKSLYLTRKG